MDQVKHIRKIRQGLYHLITGFMVIWLAVFYSALCEYHGLMLPFGPDHMAQMDDMPRATSSATLPMTLHVHHPGMNMQMPALMPPTSKSATFRHFSRVALSTIAMTLMTISAPHSLNLWLVQQQSSFVVTATILTHQCGDRPPDQPPRPLPRA